MKHSHMLICGALMSGGVALVLVGASAAALIPAIVCMAMMLAMMRLMLMRGHGHDRPSGSRRSRGSDSRGAD